MTNVKKSREKSIEANRQYGIARLNFSTFGDTMPSVAEDLIEKSAAKRSADKKLKQAVSKRKKK